MNEKTAYLKQGLASVNNFYWTGRPSKAISMLNVIKNVDPQMEPIDDLYKLIVSDTTGFRRPDLSKHFGKNWRGESLKGQSIEVFCDQGMGDTLNLIRYLIEMKRKWDCRIVLNNYAFYDKMAPLLKDEWYIDEFTNEHILCDYHTNLLSIPALFNGVDLDVYYPTHFREVMRCPIPDQPPIDVFPSKVTTNRPIGIAWQSNPDNKLSEKKSIPEEQLKPLSEHGELYCLTPHRPEHDFIRKDLWINHLRDTAAAIICMKAVVSVDTVTLHLAGLMGKTTFGLLPHEADPRWGDREDTVWYPSVRLFRQKNPGDWSYPIQRVSEELELLSKMQ